MAPAKTSSSEGKEASEKQNSAPDPMKDVSWPGIFSQHETNLKSHLEVIGMVKNHVAEGSDSFSAICGMVDRTQELVKQLEVVRKEFLPNSTADTIFGLGPGGGRKRVSVVMDREDTPPKKTRSSRRGDTGAADGNGQQQNGPSFVFDSRPTPVNPPKIPKSRKRSRGEEEKVAPEESNNLPTPPIKRKKTKSSSSKSKEKARSSDEGTTAPAAPISVETEDISAEVEARLMIKEASRQRRDEKVEKKRKRDSVNSNAEEGATSSRKPKKKKAKRSEENSVASESSGSGGTGRSKKAKDKEGIHD